MISKSWIERVVVTWRKLRHADSANVAVMFALATVPIVGFVGAAVDYSQASSAKAALQAAADSTALMLSKNAANTSASELQTKASEHLKAMFNRHATGVSVKADYDKSAGNQLVVLASADVKSSFMGLVGVPTMKIAAQSQVRWGNSRLRVALVLDTTGSMANYGKMTAMKNATKNLLDQLKDAAASPGDVYVSIIPFSKDVNVGRSNYNATWIDWSEWDEDNGSDVSSMVCTKNGKKKKCKSSTSWVPDNHNTWNGCVTDRGESNQPHSGNYDTNVTPPSINNPATLFAAEQYGSCSAQVMPLSYDFTGMKGLVDSFYPAGNTNQAIGLAHGWFSLVGGGPYPTPPAEDPRYKYQKIIILMSDGLNTEDRWYSNSNQIDGRQKITCDNVNAAGITLYTIQVNTDGDPLSTLLKNCAGSPGKYPDNEKFWMLTSANQLAAVFQQIGIQLSSLRIAQ